MLKLVLTCGSISFLCLLSYRLGIARAKLEILEKEIKVEQNISQQKSRIYSRPNASNTELLRLFRDNIM